MYCLLKNHESFDYFLELCHLIVSVDCCLLPTIWLVKGVGQMILLLPQMSNTVQSIRKRYNQFSSCWNIKKKNTIWQFWVLFLLTRKQINFPDNLSCHFHVSATMQKIRNYCHKQMNEWTQIFIGKNCYMRSQ